MQRALRSMSRLHSLVVQHSCQEQHELPRLSACLNQLSEVQQLAATALGNHNSSSSSSWASHLQSCGSVRHMAGRTHSLSLKRANNKASWMAVAPHLKQQPDAGKVQQETGEVIQTAIPPLPVLDEPLLYQRIGRITGPYSVGTQPCFAVFVSGGTQWKVTADDVIFHNKIPGIQVNDVLQFNKVLLLGTQDETTIGRPFVPGATVVAAVEENFRDGKVHVFKKKARKRYSKLQGHRSHITALRILEVRQPAAEAAVSNINALTPGQEDNQHAAVGISETQLSPQQLKQGRKRLAAARPQHETAAATPPAAAAGRPRQDRWTPAPSAAQDAGQQQHTDVAEGQEAGAGQQQQQQTVDIPPESLSRRQHGPPAVMTAFPRRLPSSSAQHESP